MFVCLCVEAALPPTGLGSFASAVWPTNYSTGMRGMRNDRKRGQACKVQGPQACGGHKHNLLILLRGMNTGAARESISTPSSTSHRSRGIVKDTNLEGHKTYKGSPSKQSSLAFTRISGMFHHTLWHGFLQQITCRWGTYKLLSAGKAPGFPHSGGRLERME